jgi:hypothetical protein
MVEADLQVGVSAPMYVVSAFRRTCGLFAGRDSRYLAPPAARHARRGSTNTTCTREIRGGKCCCYANGLPGVHLVAPVLGDRVGRLRKTPAAAPGVYRPENLLRQRTFREADQRFGALSRRICQPS